MGLSDSTKKIPSDTTGDRSRDLPTSGAVPNNYATPGPKLLQYLKKNKYFFFFFGLSEGYVMRIELFV
jgi:hypothetical protein